MPEEPIRKPGIVYTFYSFKGGVGRSMALANVAALLAKWGRYVLVVDWDLEASGIERFFLETTPGLAELRRSTPGVVDLIRAKAEGHGIEWEECLLAAYPFGAGAGGVFIITAGRSDEGYTQRMQGLDFARLFAEQDLGSYIEKLRNDWTSKFDTVLIDSRTGITDIGGICTIHLPDVLVLLFTTTESSVDGVIEVMKTAREQQTKLPFDRRRLLALPVRPLSWFTISTA
jgi:cellulose biosynthesis protein BcsQ